MSVRAAEFIREYTPRINAYLREVFPTNQAPKRLFEAMNYSLLAGGKRLRPLLCLAAAETCGVSPDNALPAAAAIEMLHCYSLVHDDLPAMDDDDLRRGKPTNHVVYGEATAILAGDALLTYAFEQLSAPLSVPAQRQLRMIRSLAGAAGCFGMVAGQMADVEAEDKGGTLDDLKFIHLHKTARLIESSVTIGALFADLPSTALDACRVFGENIGLAFQVVDDVLDVIGDESALGKRIGADEAHGKLTYPSLLGVEQSKVLAEKYVEDALLALSSVGLETDLLGGLAHWVTSRHS